MTTRTISEASGLQSLTSTLYLRLRKADREASFHCAAHYSLPDGDRGRLDSSAFRLTLHCECACPSPARPPSAPRCPGLPAPLWPSPTSC